MTRSKFLIVEYSGASYTQWQRKTDAQPPPIRGDCGCPGAERGRNETMKIQVRANSVEVSKSLQVHVVRRLRFLLSRFGQRVGGVTVQISQIGANGNTANKRCEINVLVGAKRVCVEDTDVDFLVAITHATDRVSRAVTLALVAETSGEDGLTTPKMPGALLT